MSTASEIAHAGLRIVNPIGAAALDDVLATTGLTVGARAIDVGCGKGELLIRLAEITGAGGLGVDLSGDYIAAARQAAAARVPEAGLEFEPVDARSRLLAGFDLAACVGSTHALGGDTRHALRVLADAVAPGALVLLGEGFWRREPDPAYLDVLGATADELSDYAGTIGAGAAAGLVPIYARVAGDDDWDRYEWTLIAAAERHGSPETLAYADAARRRILGPGGRDTLGFGLFLFRRGR